MSSLEKKEELLGSIREFTLADVVQFLSASKKTGRLGLTRSSTGTSGAIYFEDGAIVHADVEGREGEEAFFELMRWVEGSFSFSPDVLAPAKSVRQASTILLMEGARRNDEWGVLSEHISDLNQIPEFASPDENLTGKQITLNTSEWLVLSKIDGHRSLKEVALEAHISEYHTCRLLYPLIANKLIRLREPSR